ncbi:hypothetical protein ALP10_200175 [Pseudomonas syringae pv. helianthi]|uniref:Uncharacterized protein n=1 Tax=Pseudomonas syringae pv. helianthi TaxID=251654 RepID=A0A3M6CL34_9PSED|nr:hypothetical protein [Pseudomonas syringae group genomosp. 7]RMV44500.1 hypothetical protein ALP10_200175 [Pseudomonas syringae pv. helianthi]
MDVSIHQQPARAFDEIRHKISDLALCVDEFQVEEYISGPIRHFDGLVLNGRVITLLSSEYVGTCLDYMERGQPLGSWHIETTASMHEWVSAALQAVQIHNGAFHLEAIMVDGELDLSAFTRQQSDLGFGWFVFPGHTHPERIYQGLEGADELRASAHVVQWNELSVGALLPEHVTYSAFEAPLAGIVKSAAPQQTRAWMQSLFSRVRLAHNLTSVA